MMNRLQNLLSNTTCAATTWRVQRAGPGAGEEKGEGAEEPVTAPIHQLALTLSQANGDKADATAMIVAGGRCLHSSTFRLNVSTFYGERWVHDFPPVY
jgi:hypothetical protein